MLRIIHRIPATSGPQLLKSTDEDARVELGRLGEGLEGEVLVCWVSLDEALDGRETSLEVGGLASDSLASGDGEVGDELRVLLERLDFVTSLDASDSEHGEDVLCGVGVVVDTEEGREVSTRRERREWKVDVPSVERGGGITAETGLDVGLSSGVVLHERGDVVDETGDDDEGAGLARLLELVPREDGKVVRRRGPLDLLALGLDLLELHRVLSLLDLVVGERLEVRREAEEVGCEDEPLGGVVSGRGDGVTVVLGELVVLAKRGSQCEVGRGA
jgi:hypothetical protein